jgi:hypothetical protein
MAITQGVVVQYKTNNGSVPAITLQTRDANGDAVAASSATVADLLVLGLSPVKLTDVVKDSGTTEATVTDVGQWWIPA